ncbi:MAG: ATP-grasp domain-containing protein [Pseudoalteromonas sp.]
MKTQKTLHIIGAGFEQVPAIVLAKSMGHRVVVTDINPNAPGANLADVFSQISTNDVDNNLRFAQQQAVDGVMTLGSEQAVPVVAHIVNALKLPGLSKQTALAATNKNVMRECFRRFDVPSPKSKKIKTIEQLKLFIKIAQWPIVIKPSDSSGQRGVEFLSSESDLVMALTNAIKFSTDGFAIVEEFVEGPEINVTALVQHGEICFLSFSHRVTAPPPHFGIATEHRAPVDLPKQILASVRDASEKAIRAIGMENGIAYPQVIASPTGAQVLEIAARIPGGYMRDVALVLSGIDMVEFAIRQALAEPLAISDYKRFKTYKSVIVKFLTELDLQANTQTLTQINGFEQVAIKPGIYLANCRLEIGDNVPTLTSSAARFGAIIIQAAELSEADNLLTEALNSVVLA